jgi:hypothetical protein
MQTKLRRLARLAIAVPIALVFVLLIRVVRPLVIVRIGVMRSDRIGHFVLETELQQLEIERGIAVRPKRSFNIWYAPEPISNRVIYEMWKRVMRIWPNWFMVPVFRLNNSLPGSKAHQIPNTASTCLDVHNLIDGAPPHLSFTPSEIERGNKTLREMGLSEGDRFVCIIVRDAEYTKVTFPGKDMSYHDFRNCDIDDSVMGAEALADRGLYVIRMGSIVEKPMITPIRDSRVNSWTSFLVRDASSVSPTAWVITRYLPRFADLMLMLISLRFIFSFRRVPATLALPRLLAHSKRASA